MNYKKDIIKVVLIIIVLLLIMFPMLNIYGIPFGNLIAKNAIKKYIDFRYPQQKLSIEKVSFNLKDSTYDSKILDKNAKVFGVIKYYWKDNSFVDFKLNQELDNALDQMFNKKVQELMPSIIVVESTLWSKIKLNRNSSNGITRNDIIYIIFKNKDEGLAFNREQYIDFVKKLMNYLSQNQYNIEKIQIDYLDRNYIKKNSYMLLLNKSQINLPKEVMIKLITLPSGDMWK